MITIVDVARTETRFLARLTSIAPRPLVALALAGCATLGGIANTAAVRDEETACMPNFEACTERCAGGNRTTCDALALMLAEREPSYMAWRTKRRMDDAEDPGPGLAQLRETLRRMCGEGIERGCRGAGTLAEKGRTLPAPRSSSPPSVTTPSASAGPLDVQATSDIVIYDDTRHPDPRIEGVQQTEQTRILRRIFPRYLTDMRQCPNEWSPDARARGDIVPQISSAVTGSFTAPGVAQRLYLVFAEECGATHADNFGRSLLVVFQNDAIVAQASLNGGSLIERLFDLDGDGRLELLITSTFANHGTFVVSASLEQVGTSGLKTIEDFGQVNSSNCAGAFDPKEQEVSIIRATARPAHAPVFRVTKKKGPC